MKIPNLLKPFFSPGPRLSQRIVFAGAWMLAMRTVERILGVVRIIILARLLSPEAFGLVGVALIVLELLKTFTQLGFGEALIQHKGDIQGYLDTDFIMSAVRGLILAGILFSIAPWTAAYFNAPGAKSVIQAISITLVFNGFISSGIVYFYKELELQKRFIWESSVILSEFIVSISAAFVLRSVWALVYGAIASSIVMTILSFIMHPYRPKLRFDILKAKELFVFGGWVLLGSMAGYVFTNIDSIFVGRLLGVVTLGLYTMAHRIGDVIGQEMKIISSGVVFPTYSMLQDNLSNLRLAFLKSIEAISYIVFPTAVGIYILASDFATAVLGQQWIPAIHAMRILGIAAAIYSLVVTGGSLFYAVGKPRARFVMTVIASLIVVGLLYPLIKKYGINGAAMAVLAGNIGGLLVQTWVSKGILKSSLKQLVQPLVLPTIVSIVFGISLALAKYSFKQASIGEFIVVLCLGAAVYAACSFLLWRIFKLGPVQILVMLTSRK